MKKIESTVQRIMCLGLHSSAIEDASAGVLNEVRQSETHAPSFSLTDCDVH